MNSVEAIKDKQQLEALKKELYLINIRDYCLFVVGINCGFRISELIPFTINDLFIKKSEVRQSIILDEREFLINKSAAAALTEYLKIRNPQRGTEPLFKSQKSKNGKPSAVQRNVVYKNINAAARKAGISEQIGTITMRKTWGYMSIMNGVAIDYIQKHFNHQSKNTTIQYLGLNEDDLANIKFRIEL